MAVKKGQETRVYVGAYDLSLMATTVGVGMEAPALDKTVLVDTAESATADVRKDTFEAGGFFDDQAQSVDALLGTLIGTGGNMASLLLGTATGNRAYVGTVLVAAGKVVGRVGELARVELNVSCDGSFRAMKHFGPKRSAESGATSGTIDDSTGTSGTGYFAVHNLTYPTAGLGTINLFLEHSADGTTWASKSSFPFTGIGSTATAFTGSLDRYVRLYQNAAIGGVAWVWFGAYRRP